MGTPKLLYPQAFVKLLGGFELRKSSSPALSSVSCKHSVDDSSLGKLHFCPLSFDAFLEFLAIDMAFDWLKELIIIHKLTRSPRKFCCSLLASGHWWRTSSVGSWGTPLLTLLHHEKWTLSPFTCYHLISSKSHRRTFPPILQKLDFFNTLWCGTLAKAFWKSKCITSTGSSLCHQISGFRIHRFELMSHILSSLPPCCTSINQVLTSMLLGPASLRWTCRWTLETGWIGNESWEREGDFAVIPWKATSQDRGPCLSCVNCIFSDQHTPSGDIPMYRLSRCRNQKKNTEKCNSWGWNIKRMNKIKSRIRDKGTVSVSLRFPFYFHASWDSEQTLHCGTQEKANSTVVFMHLNQFQVGTHFLPVMGLYFPKAPQSFLILKEDDQTAEYLKAIKKRSEPFI